MEQVEVVRNWLSSISTNSWVLQVFLIVLVTLVLNFVRRRVFRQIVARLEQTKTIWDEAFFEAIGRPLSVFIWIIGLSFAIQIIQEHAQAKIFEAVGPIRDIGIITSISWFLVRFIKIAEENYVKSQLDQGEQVDRTTLDAVAKLFRLAVMITASLVALQTLGFSVSGVLAFGGIGGIAIGFAAKDLLANFFGGIVIYLDRPFAVGDWIRSPDRDIEGTVEKIGWRLTLIRTFDSRPMYIPNSAFTNIAVENPSRMDNRRIYEYVGIRYDDAMQMGPIVKDVDAMLRSHPDIDASKTLMVNFDKCAPSSLDFFVYCFTRTSAWAEFHKVKQDVLLQILDITDRHGAEIAFPTSTIHLATNGHATTGPPPSG